MSKHLTKYIEKWEAEKSLSVPEQHQKNIAIKTLKMPDAMVGVMGGMDKDEARKFLKSIGYTDAQVRKLEARQASSRVVIVSELVKIAKELVAKDGVIVINGVPFRIVGNELFIYPAGYYREDEDGVVHTTSGAEMTLRMNPSDRKALANFLTD
jgi:hypothetical protein